MVRFVQPSKTHPGKDPLMAKTRTSASVKLEKLYDVTLPDRLRTFFDSGECAKYAGKQVAGLTHFSSDTKMSVGFGHKALPMLYEYASEIFSCTPAEIFPIAALNDCEEGSFFMAVDLTQPDLPVKFFDFEEGVHDHSDSFDGFLSSLLDEGALTPAEQLAEAYKKADELRKEERHQEAIELIRPILEAYPEDKANELDDYFGQYLPSAYNLLGICCEKLDEIDNAIAYYEHALDLRSYHAGLNILDLYLHRLEDCDKLIALGEKLRQEPRMLIGQYCWFHVRRYLGYAYVLSGRQAEAVMMYHLIRSSFADGNPGWIDETKEDLEEIIKENKPNKGIARQVLRWFVPLPRQLAAEDIERNRTWWKALPKKVQTKLRKDAKIKAKNPSDQDLARVLDSTKVDIDKCDVSDLGWLAAFKHLERLEAKGNELTDLSAISQITTLERLDVGENQIKSLLPIAGLTRLTYLDCANNGLRSLEGIENLHELENLRAKENELTDIGPTAGLTSLEKITIYNNQITDLSPLGSCPRLKEISNFGNPIATGLDALADLYWLEEVDPCDLPKDEIKAFARTHPYVKIGHLDRDKPAPTEQEATALRRWWDTLDDHGEMWREALGRELEHNKKKGARPSVAAIARFTEEEDFLSLSKKGLTDLTPLAPMKRVDWLDISDNEITDLSPLANHERIKVLLNRNNKVRSIKCLAGWKHIEHFDAEGNRLESLEGMEGWSKLRRLSVENNEIVELGPLADKNDLRHLYLESNQVESLEPLRGLARLNIISFFDNKVKDLSPLADCPEIETIVCFANEGLTGLMALEKLANLRRVQTYYCVDEKEIDEFRKARPDVDVS